jgi:hypothetical protein
VTLDGIGLEEATEVNFGSSPTASFAVNPDGSITAVSPPVTAGSTVVSVTVTTPEGVSITNYIPDTEPANFFTYGPTVTSVEPDEGPAAGGTSVTIHGTGFTSPVFRGLGGPFVHAIHFGSTELSCGSPRPNWLIPCTPVNFTVNSDTEITAIASPGAGTVDVTVETDGGTSPISPVDLFGYGASETLPGAESRDGLVQLMSCRAVKGTAAKSARRKRRAVSLTDQICTSKMVAGPMGAGNLTARLVRGDVLYATGTATVSHANTRLALKPLRRVRPGRYRLTLASRRTLRHETITVR